MKANLVKIPKFTSVIPKYLFFYLSAKYSKNFKKNIKKWILEILNTSMVKISEKKISI